MILSGKKLKNAIEKDGVGGLCTASQKSPVLKCHFNTAHTLYSNEKETKPLFECSFKGDFRLPILRFLATAMAGFVLLSLMMACIKRKFTCSCKKKSK